MLSPLTEYLVMGQTIQQLQLHSDLLKELEVENSGNLIQVDIEYVRKIKETIKKTDQNYEFFF